MIFPLKKYDYEIPTGSELGVFGVTRKHDNHTGVDVYCQRGDEVVTNYLHKLNKKFRKYPFTSDYPDYHPHCTIAYVKAGTSDKYIKKLNDLEFIKAEPEKIVYSKANGEKINYKL